MWIFGSKFRNIFFEDRENISILRISTLTFMWLEIQFVNRKYYSHFHLFICHSSEWLKLMKGIRKNYNDFWFRNDIWLLLYFDRSFLTYEVSRFSIRWVIRDELLIIWTWCSFSYLGCIKKHETNNAWWKKKFIGRRDEMWYQCQAAIRGFDHH